MNLRCARRASLSSLLLILCAGSAVAATCVDVDGDGWGWDGVASCVVDTSNTANEVSTDVTSACVDEDGDGWGWDGVQSCVAGAALPDNSSVNSPDNSSAGVCEDTDGDGWGWNGETSCRAGAAAQPTQVVSPVEQQTPVVQVSPVAVETSGAFRVSKDLLAMHFDHAPDPDDGHAAAAGFVVQSELDLAVSVVGGTYGELSAGKYVPQSEALMNSIWGQTWLNAHSNRAAAVSQATTRWAGTLAGGGNIWVAEGGPSDFTAAVVQQLQQQFPEFNTRNRFNVVQHSKWTEDHANRSSLGFVKSNTRYIFIEDGNDPNSTADFREDYAPATQNFVNRARASRYAQAWNAAFNYLDPSDKLDFSDTVEVMHILGIGRSAIANPDDFARTFFR